MNRHMGSRSGVVGVTVFIIFLIALGLLKDTPMSPIPEESRSPQPRVEGTALLANLPLAFVENQGQWDTQAKFLAKKGGLQAWFEPDAITLQLAKQATEDQMQGVVVRLAFEGASPQVVMAGEQMRTGTYNYFLGNDLAKWHTNVPGYTSVRYSKLYQGIDVRVREHEGRLEYDLLLDPDADLRQVVIKTEGIERLELAADGSLIMHTALGSIEQQPPTTWYELPDGTTQPVGAKFVLLDESHYGFAVPNRNTQLALVIDPGLVLSTFLGGNLQDRAYSIARRQGVQLSSETIVVVGTTTSGQGPPFPVAPFPTTPYAFNRTYSGSAGSGGPLTGCLGDVFVSRLTADGSSLVWSTYLGGVDDDCAWDVAVDVWDRPTVVGRTSSRNFPTTIGQPFGGGLADAFVVRLDVSGSALDYSRFLGGSGPGHEGAYGVAVTRLGEAFITGMTTSADFPTTPGAFQTIFSGSGDAFVTKLDPTGTSFVYSTFLGGSDFDEAWDIAITSDGAATIAGLTGSLNFPVTPGAIQQTLGGGVGGVYDAFLSRVNPAGNILEASTFLGGSGFETAGGVAVDEVRGLVAVGGSTASTNFPTTPGTFQPAFGGGSMDAFVAVLVSSLFSAPAYLSYLGGSVDDYGYDVAMDSAGRVIAVGDTTSANFPTTLGAYDLILNNGPSTIGSDMFVAQVHPTGSHLLYSTFLGGTAGDFAMAAVLDDAGGIYVAGDTGSPDFPMAPGSVPYDPTFNGLDDAVIADLALLPSNVLRDGYSTPACNGLVILGADNMPQAGQWLTFTVMNAYPNSLASLLISAGPVWIEVGGIGLFVDPNLLVTLFSSVTDAAGAASFGLNVPPGTSGLVLYAQAISQNGAWVPPNPATVPNTPGCQSRRLAASGRLTFTIAP